MLFDREGQTIIISPFNNFMAASFWQDSISGGRLCAGTMGGVRHVPPLYKQTFMIVFGSSINKVNIKVKMFLSLAIFLDWLLSLKQFFTDV